MVHLYILRSDKDGSYYIGQTKNLNDRLQRHNAGRCISTKSKVPWRLVYTEKHNCRDEAVRREKRIKREKSRKYIENLIKQAITRPG